MDVAAILCLCLCVSQTVIEEVYKVIAHIYLKRLVQISQSKLTKYWSPDVSQTVTEDAELLHNTMSDLVGSRFWHYLFKKKKKSDCSYLLFMTCYPDLHVLLQVPGVQQWNLMLLKVAELLKCTDTDAVTLTAAFMQKDCLIRR